MSQRHASELGRATLRVIVVLEDAPTSLSLPVLARPSLLIELVPVSVRRRNVALHRSHVESPESLEIAILDEPLDHTSGYQVGAAP